MGLSRERGRSRSVRLGSARPGRVGLYELVALVAPLALVALACGPRPPPSSPTADIVKVPGPWSYCEVPEGVSLSRENSDMLQSDALHARSDASYDLMIVPGYTPDDATKPLGTVHPIAAARLDHAVELYRNGASNLILVSGGNVHPAHTPHNEALTMKAYLLERGLSESAVVVEPCARHSTTNLRNAGRFMLKFHLRTALVVTSVDQAFYFANGRLSSFEIRSRAELGYMVGSLKNHTANTLEFAPSTGVLRRGPDPLDP